jgi:hypothetical protein
MPSSSIASGIVRASFVALLAGACSFNAKVNGSGSQGGGGTTGVHVDGAAATGMAFDGNAVIGPSLDAACGANRQTAMRAPLDMYIMMDSSGSMDATTANGTTKWDAVRMAFTAFFQDPQSNGLGVGLQYFPLLRPGVPGTCEASTACGAYGPCDISNTCDNGGGAVVPCNTAADCGRGVACIRLGACAVSGGLCAPAGGACSATRNDTCTAIPGYCDQRDICDTATYATPAVEVATLPGARAALVASLNGHMVDGLTPTSGALGGAIAHAQALARANPTHRVVAVLATDGLPDECTPNDIAGVAAIATAGVNGTPSISTFVIGVFAPDEATVAQPNLDTLAMAGGTTRSFVINTSMDVTQQFEAALNSIRSTGLTCQYRVPSVTVDGGMANYFMVNVQFTSGSNQTVTIGNVANQAACDPTKGGWYYDTDPRQATPQTINICDASCNTLKADPNGRVDILLGCDTVPIVP